MIQNLRDFTKCPNYAKYNWSNTSLSPKKTTTLENVIRSVYTDTSNYEKILDWKTVRSKLTAEVAKTSKSEEIYSQTIKQLESLRSWFMNSYRDMNTEIITNLDLELKVNELQIKDRIEYLVINPKTCSLIEFTEMKPEQVLRDIGIRTKIYLLSQQGIKIKSIISIHCTEDKVSYLEIGVYDYIHESKIDQILDSITLSIKNKAFYPSITQMCATCKYRTICSW